MRFWNDRKHLDFAARTVRGAGWLLAALILVVGTVLAAKEDGQLSLLLRALMAGAILAGCTFAAWLIDLYARRTAVQLGRQGRALLCDLRSAGLCGLVRHLFLFLGDPCKLLLRLRLPPPGRDCLRVTHSRSPE